MINLFDFLEGNINKETEENKVILHDISKKNYNDLHIGDKLISSDNSIIEIKNIKEIKENLYKIHQKYGKSYIISESQSLSLINKNGIKINIPVLEYIKHINDINNYVLLDEEKKHNLSTNLKSENENENENNNNENENNNVKEHSSSFIEKKYEELLGNSDEDFVKINDDSTYIEIQSNIDKTNREDIYYGYKNYIIFSQLQINVHENYYILEPYLFGYWYGTHNITNFKTSSCKNHIPINNELQKRYIISNISKYNLKLTQFNKNSETYYINHNNMVDIIELFITKYNLLSNYDIPKIYKYTNINDRLKVLSGILDASFIYSDKQDTKDKQDIDKNIKYYICKSNTYHKVNFIQNVLELANTLGVYTKINKDNDAYIYVKYEKKIGENLKLEYIENKSEILIEKLKYDTYYQLEFNDNSKQYLLDDYTILYN